MGISRSIESFERQTLERAEIAYQGVSWCELGNQMYWDETPAKAVYVQRGARHTSLDLNGADGALVVDLDQPLITPLVNSFRVVTNYGTLEHVNNQYQCLRNMHELCINGGLMIHALPLIGSWPDHCRYYYEEWFIRTLAAECRYDIVTHAVFDSGDHQAPLCLLMAGLRKSERSTFIKQEAIIRLGIIDTGFLRNTGNYTVRT